MDFNDTPEEAKFRAEARKFLETNCKPKAAENDRMSRSLKPEEYMKAAKAYQRKKADAGFAGITWAKEQGGRGLAPILQRHLQPGRSEVRRARPACSPSGSACACRR